MESFQNLIDLIPVRYDLSSHIMLLGIVQGLFLSLVIFFRTKRDSAIYLFGWALLVQCLVFADIYLCYTGLMKYMLHFNDSTEALVLLITPTLYFFLYTLLTKKSFALKRHWPHFILPLVYGLTQINFYLSPIEVKLNAYLGAYHRDLGFVEVPDTIDYSYHFIKDRFRWILLFNFTFYLFLSSRLLLRAGREKGIAQKSVKVDKYTFSKNAIGVLTVLLASILWVFLNYDDDGGDHYIGILQTVVIFITSFFILSESRFFEKSWIADKYETLASTTIQFADIEALMEEDYYCNSGISLKDVAEKLNVSPNLVSKLINSETGMNFNDFINQKRIGVAKIRLLDQNYGHLTVEAIGNTVGFNSKSVFYNAFKKHVGQSPSNFIKQQMAKNIA
ncbi:MAG: AraC family transcriptional regulator [Allomuricauda sp.]